MEFITDEEKSGDRCSFYFGIAALAGGKWSLLPRPGHIGDGTGKVLAINVRHIQTIGNELFIQDYAGVYAGVEKWRRICDGVPVGLMTSADGKKMIIARLVPQTRDESPKPPGAARRPDPKVERGTYDPESKQLTWADWPIPKNSEEAYRWDELPGLTRFAPELITRGLPVQGFKLPTSVEQPWGMVLVYGDRYSGPPVAVISRDDAIWLIDRSVVMRFDRRQLEQALAAAK
jgi:hypothetical protein